MTTTITTGANLRTVLAWTERLGCRVRHKTGTGELIVWHPLMGRSIRVNVRKKSASRALTTYLRRIERFLGQ